MLNSIRSRRIPATQTTPSIRPKVSTAVCTIRSPPSIVVTESATATALPPAGLDLRDDGVGDLARRVLAVDAHAVVVDHDVRAGRGARKRHRAADPAPGSGDRDRLVVEIAHVMPLVVVGGPAGTGRN